MSTGPLFYMYNIVNHHGNTLLEKFFFKKINLFILLHWFFCCGMQDIWLQHPECQLQHVGSSSLTKDQTRAPCIGSEV